MDIELIGGVSAVVLIIALVQLIKSLGFEAKYCGLLAVAFGLAASLGFTYYGETSGFKAVVMGLAIGLSAAGLWSTAKNAAGK